MAHWRLRVLVLGMIVGQILAGSMTGRTIYLAHCGENHEHDQSDGHDAPLCFDHEGAACLASFDHHHEDHSGHDHRCQCSHVHVRSDMRLVQRQRIEKVLRNTLATPRSAIADSQSAPSLHDGQTLQATPNAVARSSLPQTLAIRASRLLI